MLRGRSIRKIKKMLKLFFDKVLAIILIISFSWMMVLIAIMIKIETRGPVIYWSKRVGRNNKLFDFPKFRTMRVDTPTVATHLLESPESYVTWFGRILRLSSLDEVPQLWCILMGTMSFVGPRPALYNQDDLIELRNQAGINMLTPGLTGWAQINGRDNLDIYQKVALDKEYLMNKSLLFDLKIIAKTARYIFSKAYISH